MIASIRVRPWHCAVALLISAAAVPAWAQFTGQGAQVATPTVADILSKPVDGQMVRVQGHLLRKLKSETYIFSDGTGEIVMEIDDDDFPQQPVSETTKIEVVGEVDTGLRRPPEIEAESVRVLP
ncbi:NirD/YgiW/YdeI family stress tolerance protein [Bordetella sp. BOR01]|uniref:NirD/YgiW/YdeI family stress tolerance protein n=1 Tax=Bordetella sp. BOR01 TaxID=2854779 RepID=UPI001C439351|nr:NirD/YgiW/YdeI family stress tolerance protein [Bordetella sp. BOR01]MBV7485346.1 NirD/YgiW/YdeI family stress tolerance protein [Bordetella sp. BOR01]